MKIAIPAVVCAIATIFGVYTGYFDMPLSPLSWRSEIVEIPAEVDGRKIPRYGITLAKFSGNVTFTDDATRIFVTLIDEGLTVGSPFTPTERDLYKSLLTGYAPFKDVAEDEIHLLQGEQQIPLIASTLGKKFKTAYRYDPATKKVTGIANRDGTYQTNLVVMLQFGPIPPQRRHDLVLVFGGIRLPLVSSWTAEQIARQPKALARSFAAGGGVLFLFGLLFLWTNRREGGQPKEQKNAGLFSGHSSRGGSAGRGPR
ncbi:MAG: hypothetical protein D6812_08435 [Deltaproteobacteria bacterium]|nr:MAG: hypothetical protein D6812_08435 [Deltaproteobacteria bacterium]